MAQNKEHLYTTRTYVVPQSFSREASALSHRTPQRQPQHARAQARAEADYAVVGNTAVEREPEPRPELPDPARQPRPRTRRRLMRRALMIAWVMGIVAVGCVVLSGYMTIHEQYRAVRSLRKEIQEARIRLDELSVAVECAVDLDTIRANVSENAMGFPAADQIITLNGVAAKPQKQADDSAAGQTPAE